MALAFMLCLYMLIVAGMAFSAGGQQSVNNEDGTVTDNGTGLMCLRWQKDTYWPQCVGNEDGSTVTDVGAGLMWQTATAGQMNWDAAMSYASGLTLGGNSDWRLPNKDELKGLYDSPCKDMMDVRIHY